jgi:hypothetical protein
MDNPSSSVKFLASVVQKTFGNSSHIHNNQYISFRTDDKNQTIKVLVNSLVSVNMKENLSETMKKFREEALEILAKNLKKLQESYKEQRELCLDSEVKKGVSFKVDQKSILEDMEYTQTTMHSHLKKGIYKMNLLVEVSFK